MPVRSFEVKNYVVSLGNYYSPDNQLYLYGATNEWMAWISFRDTPQGQNQQEITQGQTIPIIYTEFRSDFYATAIDLLRNEKPVTFQWNSQYAWAKIVTGKEPVGDEEARQFFRSLAAR